MLIVKIKNTITRDSKVIVWDSGQILSAQNIKSNSLQYSQKHFFKEKQRLRHKNKQLHCAINTNLKSYMM